MISKFLKRNWIFYIFGFAFLALNATINTQVPQALGDAISLLESGAAKNDVMRQALIIGLIGVAAFVTRFIWRTFIIGTARRLDCWLRERLYTKFQHLPISFYANKSSGDLMAYAINDINAVRLTFGPALAMSFNGIVTATISIVTMILEVDPILTVLALLPVPFTIIYTTISGRIVRRKFSAVQALFSKLSGFVNESISGIRIIKAFATEDARNEEFSKISSDMRDANISLVYTSSMVNPVIKATFGLSYALALIFGGQAVIEGTLDTGTLVTFLGLLLLVQNPVVQLGDIINRVQRGLASYKRLKSIDDEISIPESEFEETDEESVVEGKDITVKNLTFTYPDGEKPALNNISFTIKSGSTIGIAGATGSGKTTLIATLAKLLPTPDGSILFGDADINETRASTLRKDIGYVPQDGFLFSATIAQNIAFCDESPNMEKIKTTSELACITIDEKTFSNGYETEVGERGTHLSGGQKQRISLARAFYRTPSLLLLDDTLSAVDTVTEQTMLKNIKDLPNTELYKDKKFRPTTVIISHKLSAIEDCDEILYMDNGEIAERGTHKELMDKQGLYAKMYELQHMSDTIKIDE